MNDKNDGGWAPGDSLYNAGYRDCRRNRGEVKRVALFCGALLGAVFACNVCAETEASPGLSSQETAQIAVKVDQPLLDRQVMLKVANLQEGYDKKGVVVENSGQDNLESEEGKMGVPYAIILAMVALIGLVPVARRNGSL